MTAVPPVICAIVSNGRPSDEIVVAVRGAATVAGWARRAGPYVKRPQAPPGRGLRCGTACGSVGLAAAVGGVLAPVLLGHLRGEFDRQVVQGEVRHDRAGVAGGAGCRVGVDRLSE